MCRDDCDACMPCKKHRPRTVDDTLDNIIRAQGFEPYRLDEWEDDRQQAKRHSRPEWQKFLSEVEPPDPPKNLEQEHCTPQTCIWMTKEYESILLSNPVLHKHVMPRSRKRTGKSFISCLTKPS